MKTIYDYVKTYGKYDFIEKEFTEIDSLILSLLSYVDFRGIVPYIGNGSIKLKDASDILFKKYSKKKIERYLNAVQRSTYLLGDLSKTKRYKNLYLLNYRYKTSRDMQFGALCIKLPNRKMFVSFEGTDGNVSGWKEDFMMSSTFPQQAHKEAIRYLNQVVHIFGPKVYIGGHSKGGNLSLVASMYSHRYVYNKIINIYSFDGPGLRLEELNSDKYNRVKEKYIHIIPEESFVGILFKNENKYDVIKSSKKKFAQHDATTWLIDDDKFVRGKMSDFTKKCRRTLENWLDKMDYQKQTQFIKTIFDIFDKAKINDLMEIREARIKSIYTLYKEAKNTDRESEKLLSTCFKDLYKEWKK